MVENIIQGDSGNYWVLIFHHNIAGSFFKNDREVMRSNTEDKFSILYKINSIYQNEESMYEFLLTYPQSTGYVHWIQKDNPLYRYGNNSYEIINNTYTDAQPFEGLSISNSEATLIDGQPSSTDWYYAIGQKRSAHHNISNSFAGPNWKIQGENITEVNLYLKLFDSSLIRRIYSFESPIILSNSHKYIHLTYIFCLL